MQFTETFLSSHLSFPHWNINPLKCVWFTFYVFLPAFRSSSHSAGGWTITTWKLSREKGGKGEWIEVQSPPLPQLWGEGPELRPQPLERGSFTLFQHLLIGAQVWARCSCLRWTPRAIWPPCLPRCHPAGTESYAQQGAPPAGKKVMAQHAQSKNLDLNLGPQPPRPVVCLLGSWASLFTQTALGLI